MTVATISHVPGQPSAARIIVGTVVTSSSSMIRGFVSATKAPCRRRQPIGPPMRRPGGRRTRAGRRRPARAPRSVPRDPSRSSSPRAHRPTVDVGPRSGVSQVVRQSMPPTGCPPDAARPSPPPSVRRLTEDVARALISTAEPAGPACRRRATGAVVGERSARRRAGRGNRDADRTPRACARRRRGRLGRAGPQGRGHGASARGGRRREGRQRPPRHGDQPGAAGVPALPAARCGTTRADPHWLGPRPLRALGRPLLPDHVHPALPGAASASSSSDLEALRTVGLA